MTRDDRFYAFIVDHTSRSRNRIRKISIHKRWLKVSAVAGLMLLCAALYGIYGLAQRVVHARIERENNRLREENQKQREQLNKLENRVEAIEDAASRLKEMSGVTAQDEHGEPLRGAGGPLLLMDAETIAAVEYRASFLERELQTYESVLRERERVPSIWPVEGRITDGFGVRGNPFGGGSSEFHSGQDIAAAWGTPVVAAGTGTVAVAGTQNGYGQIVIVDHGNGLSTRYGHLSRIEVEIGQQVTRGDRLGAVGSTGRSTGPHLHYEVRINEAAVSPRRYLPAESTFPVENTP